MVINTILSRKRPAGLDFTNSPSKAKQSFAKEADINNIMAQYLKTGVLPAGERQPLYGDFSDVEDYKHVLQRISETESDFALLPSEVRGKFQNSPENLLLWLSDPANKSEAVQLGIIAGNQEPASRSNAAAVAPAVPIKEPEKPVPEPLKEAPAPSST